MMQDPYYEEGFTQYKTGRVVDEYHGIAHVFHSYYGKDSEDYEKGAWPAINWFISKTDGG